MSALVCGKRSPGSLFDEEYSQYLSSPVPAAKRIRCVAALHFSPPPPAAPTVPSPPPASGIDQLRSLYPHMDEQLLERALEAAGNDLDIAIKSLNDLCLETELDVGDNKSNFGNEANISPSYEGTVNHSGINGGSQNQSTSCNLPTEGFAWVELIVGEMSNASSMDDARARATRVFWSLEKSITERACAEATQSFHKENVMLKEQVQKLLHDMDILRRGFKTLHGRKEEFDQGNLEIQELRQMVAQRNEQLQKLEIENYELKLRLMREQQSTPIPGRFHPDIFG